MFGELISIWLIDFLKKQILKKINLIELGPGNGTLIVRCVKSTEKNLHSSMIVYQTYTYIYGKF